MRAFGILFFAHKTIYGWSEVYPLNTTDYTTAQAALVTIKNQRLSLLLSDSFLIGARISDTDVKGDSYPTSFVFPQAGTYAAATGEQTFNPDYALRCSVFANALKRSKRFIRALPSTSIDASGNFVSGGVFATALASFWTNVVPLISIATRIKAAVNPPYYQFQQVVSAVGTQMERRQVGRPFGLRVGRRLIA